VFAGKFSTYSGSDPAVEGQRYHATLVVSRSVKPARDRSGVNWPWLITPMWTGTPLGGKLEEAPICHSPMSVSPADPQIGQRCRHVGQPVPAAVQAEERVLDDVFCGRAAGHDDGQADQAEHVLGIQGRHRGRRAR
jgi:hypothetical protein